MIGCAEQLWHQSHGLSAGHVAQSVEPAECSSPWIITTRNCGAKLVEALVVRAVSVTPRVAGLECEMCSLSATHFYHPLPGV